MPADTARKARPFLAVLIALTACRPIGPPPPPHQVVRTWTPQTPFVTTTPETR